MVFDTCAVAGHELTLLENGVQFFPALCDDIHSAQHYVFLESYIFQADEAGALISAALLQAAQRGVLVHVLLDGFGSNELPEDWIWHWQAQGIILRWFRRDVLTSFWRRQPLRRLHRKLAVIDGRVAYVGGINIVNDVPSNALFDQPRLDYSVRVLGAVVAEVERVMRHLWDVVGLATLQKRGVKWRYLLQKSHGFSGQLVSLIVRDNLAHRHDIERAYLRAILSAKQEIILANPYFLPGRRFRYALKRAARRGVQVILLLQGQVEYRLQHYATAALYPDLIASGIHIYEYQASFLHAKAAVFDGGVATVGSSNLDPFSLLLAREANLWVDHADFANLLRGSLLRAIECGAVLVKTQQLSCFKKFVARFSFVLIRGITGLFAYNKRW